MLTLLSLKLSRDNLHDLPRQLATSLQQLGIHEEVLVDFGGRYGGMSRQP